MALQPLRILKNWFTNTNTREKNWDEIADNVTAHANRTNNNFKQVGLDISGPTYEYNNNGVKTQVTPITDRLTALEAASFDVAGGRNLAFDLSDSTTVKLTSADGTALSSTNIGYATFNSTTTGGELITRQITADISLVLTGAHWGHGTNGDLTDHPLWVLLLDTGSGVIMGIANDAGRRTVTQADDETVATSANSIEKVFVNTALAAELNCFTLAMFLANFDDTGNPGGEDHWTIQTGVGDVDIGIHSRAISASEIYF